MAWVVTAVVGTGLLSSYLGSKAAGQAADAETNAANQANQTQLGIYNDEKANSAPWLQSGNAALTQLNSEMPDLTRKFTSADFVQDPGYQFQLQQGQQAMQRSAAAKGLLNSVGTQENLNSYSQGMANTDYQQALGNFTNSQAQRYNMLSGLSGQGLSAANMTNAAAANAGNNISSNQMASGNAQAAGYVGQANAVNSGLSTGANGLMNYSLMNQLINKPGLQPGVSGSVPGYSIPSFGSSAAPPPTNYGLGTNTDF